MKRLAVLLALLTPAAVRADTLNLELTVRGGPHDLKQAVCVVPLSVPQQFADGVHVELKGQGVAAEGQLTAPGLTTEHIKPAGKDRVRRDLHFILPELKREATLALKCEINTGPSKAPDQRYFQWGSGRNAEYVDLEYVIRDESRRIPVMRYMFEALDESSKDARDRTYKVFHHLFDPSGKRLVTNGGPTGLYPHHRGLMYAFNKITYDNGKKKADTWHCTNDAYQSHQEFLRMEGGPIVGRHRVVVGWHGPKKEMFAKEERELTVYKVPGGTLVEFASRLKTLAGPVRLDGDPQHAGFQFRASDEMSRTGKKETYYLRPDGKGKPGETRNWEPKTGKGPVDLPWDAMSFVLGGQRYTVEYVSGPKNPHPERYSERDYGRFGCYFAYDLTEERPLVVSYRVWMQDGEMTGEQAEVIRRAFVAPPQGAVKGER